jgi:predicted transcriptional regulator
MTQKQPEKLSRREREIMNALHANGGRASAEEIRQGLIEPPSYSAVRAMLVKLEGKGYVQHHEEGLKYVYSPTESQSTARRRALGQLVEVFFGGSPGQTVAALLKQEKWTNEELDKLNAEIEAARKKRSKS